MIHWIVLSLYCALLGAVANYSGMRTCLESFSLLSAKDIAQCRLGIIAIIASWIFFYLSAVSGKALIDTIKDKFKGD